MTEADTQQYFYRLVSQPLLIQGFCLVFVYLYLHPHHAAHIAAGAV
jgi:hypothetical protein